MVGLVVTPTTWSRATRLARLPLVSRSRLRSSSQIETPALLRSASRSAMIVILSGGTLRGAPSLSAARRVGPQRAQQGRRDRLRAVRPYAAQRHAGVLRLQHHADTGGAKTGGQA